MKFVSTAFILLFASFSGVALAGVGQPIDATVTSLQASHTDNRGPRANNLEQKSAESNVIRCACVVPMTYA